MRQHYFDGQTEPIFMLCNQWLQQLQKDSSQLQNLSTEPILVVIIVFLRSLICPFTSLLYMRSYQREGRQEKRPLNNSWHRTKKTLYTRNRKTRENLLPSLTRSALILLQSPVNTNFWIYTSKIFGTHLILSKSLIIIARRVRRKGVRGREEWKDLRQTIV